MLLFYVNRLVRRGLIVHWGRNVRDAQSIFGAGRGRLVKLIDSLDQKPITTQCYQNTFERRNLTLPLSESRDELSEQTEQPGALECPRRVLLDKGDSRGRKMLPRPAGNQRSAATYAQRRKAWARLG